MRIFIDESGAFQIPKTRDEHAAGVVVGVIVPEVCEQALFDRYAEFTASLGKSEREHGEPKGSRISRESRSRFADVLVGTPGVMFIPTTVDLSDLAGHADKLPSRLSKPLLAFAGVCIHQSMRDELTLLSRQVENLSVTELLKLVLYAECIQECVHHAVAYLSEPPYRDCWHKVDIVIDRLTKNPGSREKQIFQKMLPSWLAAWSAKRPLMLINEVHTSDHPFVQNFDTGDGIDMRRLVGDGIRWVDSAKEPGVQIADIAAAIVFSAVHDLKNHDNRHPDFLSLMRCCPLAARDGPGLVTLLPEGQELGETKYRSLVLALASKFPKRSGKFKGLRQPPAWATQRRE